MIGPSIANPMLWGSGDPLDELAKIDRSLRLRSAAGSGLTRTPAASNRLKWTYSAWVKPSASGQYGALIGATISAGVSEEVLRFNNNGQIEFIDGAVGMLATSVANFRDPSAHAHVMAVYDSANATPADRFILYWNGVRLATSGTISASRSSYINAATAHGVGRPGSVVSTSLDGYLSHVSFVDGKALSPSDFGQLHPRTGQWRPKSKPAIRAAVAAGGGSRNGWGANGFFLPFDDVTSLMTLGYDRSQSDTDTAGNNWTATNISLTAGSTYDSMLDTPTNNYCTINPLWNTGSPTTYANGALDVSISGNSVTALSTQEFSYTAYAEFLCGAFAQGNAQSIQVATSKITGAGAYYANGTKDGATAYGAAYAAGDLISVKVDPIAGTTEFFKNNVSQGVQNFTPTGAALIMLGLGGSSGSAAWTANFGQRPWAYSPPAGAKALCTKNLPVKSAMMKGASAFVAVTDSGANITAILAAAAPWSNWIRIYKRRDAAEGWRWQFSDDSVNYLDSSSTAAKAALPALAGASYAGYALKVAAVNGITTGRLTHVNGVADVVADGLATARKLVILKNEATGVWYTYHPDLTAGKLLYLEQTSAETTDSTISAVTASGFTVAAALASGTYRWIALAEADGFLKLGKYTGSGSADGPYMPSNHDPAMLLVKSMYASTDGFHVIDRARSASNVANNLLFINKNSAEVVASAFVDMVSNGGKLRAVGTDYNQNGASCVYLTIASSPFRYSNAR